MKRDTPFSRRRFLATSGLAATGIVLASGLPAAGKSTATQRQPIKIGQIGTANQHAYKIGSLRKLTDLFEVVGYAEDDPKLREKRRSTMLSRVCR